LGEETFTFKRCVSNTGHGLSYGNLSFTDLKVDGRTVSFNVAGSGCDTPQVTKRMSADLTPIDYGRAAISPMSTMVATGSWR
jgi:hypothetical protein